MLSQEVQCSQFLELMLLLDVSWDLFHAIF